MEDTNDRDFDQFVESAARFAGQKLGWRDDAQHAHACAGAQQHLTRNTVARQLMAAMKLINHRRWTDARATLEPMLALCESPIEVTMLLALWTAGQYLFGTSAAESGLDITPQAVIAGYRTDFKVTIWGGTGSAGRRALATVIVECDGQAFHKRTRQQVDRDRRRDLELRNNGYRVFRYSGSDIWGDVFEAANEVLIWLAKAGLQALSDQRPEETRTGGQAG